MEIIENLKDVVCNAADTANSYLEEELSVTRKTILIVSAFALLLGTIYGFCVSPVRKGIHIEVTNYENDEGDKK